MRRTSVIGVVTAAMAVAGMLLVGTANATRGGEGGRGDGPVVYVIGQDLYYDSVVVADPLPPDGPFQQLLEPDATDDRLRTQYGPGDPEYLGGRWWVDVNGDDEMNEGDHFFSCPLLPPGRDMP